MLSDPTDSGRGRGRRSQMALGQVNGDQEVERVKLDCSFKNLEGE